MIVAGHSVHISVRRGCLMIKTSHEEHVIERVPLNIKNDSLTIICNIGIITIEAMAWMQQTQLPWCVIWRDQGIVAASSGHGDPQTWQRQVTVDPLPVIRYLLEAKLRGQAVNAEILGCADTAKRIGMYADRLSMRDSLTALTGQEGRAASMYWDLWRHRVTVPWIADHMLRVPPRWLRFADRESLAMRGSNRRATDPVNAMLNYSYRVGESLAIQACYEAGLSPILGMGHVRKHVRSRDGESSKSGMALDLLEAVRPGCDAVVLGMLDYGQGIVPYLRWHDFLELQSGVVRVESAVLREQIIEGCEALKGEVSEYAWTVREMLQ